MSPNLQIQFQRLRDKGWSCVENTVQSPWPTTIDSRYPWISEDFREAMVELLEVISPDQACWLLTLREYVGGSDSAFAWNEWEQQSMEVAGDDLEWVEQIQSFWAKHLPIALSVREGYAYFALREDGSVVEGREPEFEETTVVASSYDRFIEFLANNTD